MILKDATGIIRPSRITLLLGPPGAGKTTFLLSLAGKLDHNLRKTCAYISQHELHHGEMTVGETLNFAAHCLGMGARYERLAVLSRREKEAGIKPDPEVDAFMKGIAISGQKSSLFTDYVLKILGLDICSDIMVGDDMRRGISGGQKKRVTAALRDSKNMTLDEDDSKKDASGLGMKGTSKGENEDIRQNTSDGVVYVRSYIEEGNAYTLSASVSCVQSYKLLCGFAS